MTDAVIADLVGAMRAACAAIDADNSRFPWLAERRHLDQWAYVGERMLSSWSEQMERPEKPKNRTAVRCLPMSELRVAGWSIVQIPVLKEFAELLGPRLAFFHENEWLAVPPEGSGIVARKFSGPAKAQIWATECQVAMASGKLVPLRPAPGEGA